MRYTTSQRLACAQFSWKVEKAIDKAYARVVKFAAKSLNDHAAVHGALWERN